MKVKDVMLVVFVLIILISAADTLYAFSRLNGPMQELLNSYADQVKAEKPDFQGFSVAKGKRLFYSTRIHSKKKKERSCTTCHTKDPGKSGRTTVGKKIEPVSPAINKKRFTDPKKVEKWFRRNCKWVLERECTPEEKGDYITFMMSL
ncbi:MAG: DUF1924 domain-containing protein [Thermodesulfobacteriota bacterium]